MKKTNTTPATTEATTTTEEPKKEKTTRAKKEKAPATPAPATEPTTEEPKKKGFSVSGYQVTLPTFKVTVKPVVIDGELAFNKQIEVLWKEATLPKIAIIDNIANFAKLTLGKVLDNTVEKFTSKINALDKKSEKNDLTLKEIADKEAYQLVLNSIALIRTTTSCNNSSLVYDDMAHLFACKFTKDKLPVETSQLRNAFEKCYKVLTSILEKVMSSRKTGEKIQLTEEEENAIKCVKDALKSTFEKFGKATTWCNEFTLSVSDKDVLYFFEVSVTKHDSNGNPIFIWAVDKNGKDSNILHEELVNWYFKKLKASTDNK